MPRKELYQKYKAQSIAYSKQWRASNKESHAEYSKNYRESHQEENAEYFREYAKTHREHWNFHNAKRRAQKKLATPKWLTVEQIKEMKLFYKNCPRGFEVDHIEPLKGKDVNGLHVPWNLQYLPKAANRKKSNKVKRENI